MKLQFEANHPEQNDASTLLLLIGQTPLYTAHYGIEGSSSEARRSHAVTQPVPVLPRSTSHACMNVVDHAEGA